MIFIRWWLVMLMPLAVAAAPASPPAAAQIPFVVKGPQGERVDEYHWLRDDDPKQKRPEVMAYLEAENAYTAALMAPQARLMEQLVAEMRSRIREDDDTVPVYDGGYWYWKQYEPGREHPVLWRRKGGPVRPDPKARAEVLLDLNRRAEGLAYYQLGDYAVSPDGRWLAWTEDSNGRRIHRLRVRDLVQGIDLPDSIPGVLEPVAWANDNRTLLYVRQDPVTLQSGPVVRHRVGSADDRVVFEEADKTQFTEIRRSASRRWLIIGSGGFDSTETWALSLDRPAEAARRVFARKPGVRHRVDHHRGRWLLRTNENAPDFRLVEAPDRSPDRRAGWRDLVPARPNATVEAFAVFDRAVAVEERVGGSQRLRLLRPGQRPLLVPGVSNAGTMSLGDHRDPAAAQLRYEVTSMVLPTATYDLMLATGQAVLRKRQPVPGYDASRYATERVFVTARDGARIPVTLAWRNDRARRDGSAPLYLQGYGSYGSSWDPGFSSARVSLMDRGFVTAIVHVRGGAEMGQAWYEAGRLMNKKNTFNDFVDATSALVRERWGAADAVFASGGSAGGLLMGVIANEAGAKYRGIALHVPFVDVVTTMLDATIPLTANEWTQWGDPREKAAHDYMLSYSPYDNIEAKPYPALYVSTGLWDSQVQYFEPAKYVARLRAKKTDTNPLVFHVNLGAGHGGLAGRFERLADVAREHAFFLGRLGRTE